MSTYTTSGPAPQAGRPDLPPAPRWVARLFLVGGGVREAGPFRTYLVADQVGRRSLLDVEVRSYLVAPVAVRQRGPRP